MIKRVRVSNQKTYMLMRPWYSSASVLQTNVQLASYISKSNTDLVTIIGTNNYRVYCYEGKLNLTENAVVLLCWKEVNGLELTSMKGLLSEEV